MTRQIAVVVAALSILGSGPLFAQEAVPGPGRAEVTLIPGGGTFFTSADNSPSFGNYTLGGALTYNPTRIIGIEGEVGGTIGLAQDLRFGAISSSTRTPDLLNYTANLVVSAPTGTAVVPCSQRGARVPACEIHIPTESDARVQRRRGTAPP